MAILLADLSHAVDGVSDRLPPSTVLTVGGRVVVAVEADRPCPLGPRVRSLLLGVVVAQLAAHGCLSFGTTLGECMARRLLPADVDPDLTVASMLADVAAPGDRPASTAVVLLERVVTAVSGQPLARAVADLVSGPIGMTTTRWEGEVTSTARDLTRLATSELWAQTRARTGWASEPGTARAGAADHPNAGMWRHDALDMAVAYCGDARPLLTVLDQLAS